MLCFFQTSVKGRIYHTNVSDGGTASSIKAEGGVGNRVGTIARCRGRWQRHRGRRRRWRGVEGGRVRNGDGVGDDDGGTTGGVEADGGVDNGVGAMGSGMVRQGWGRRRGSGTTMGALSAVLRPKAGTARRRGRRQRHRGRRCRWRGVEGGGGAEGRKFGQPDGVGGVTPLIPDTL
jgi:hypothetical protein